MRRPQKRVLAALTAAAVVHFAPLARADLPDERDHALPCRPTIACTADIVPPGTFEVEAGVLYRRIDARTRKWTFPLLLKQTFTETVQLQVASNGYNITRGVSPAHFLGDITIGPKLHLLDQTAVLPAVALSAVANIPTFPANGYVRTYDVLMTGYVTKELGPVHADLNVGLNVWRVDDRPLPQPYSALALTVNVFAPLAVMLEGYVFADASPVTPKEGGVLFALSQNARTWLVFDEGFDVGFFPSTRAYSLFVGMTIIPAVLWRPAPKGGGAT